ncbi:hypothetical protein TIFTF001_021798 [Ficus carica]|uniref:Uncharacterized protein n=1 Tax=Ficus carica TaxID=3494 RepID=A0AA88AV72_FICCA|nr:hypothetical protein TIFTF001_021798 [Ficus carica]
MEEVGRQISLRPSLSSFLLPSQSGSPISTARSTFSVHYPFPMRRSASPATSPSITVATHSIRARLGHEDSRNAILTSQQDLRALLESGRHGRLSVMI